MTWSDTNTVILTLFASPFFLGSDPLVLVCYPTSLSFLTVHFFRFHGSFTALLYCITSVYVLSPPQYTLSAQSCLIGIAAAKQNFLQSSFPVGQVGYGSPLQVMRPAPHCMHSQLHWLMLRENRTFAFSLTALGCLMPHKSSQCSQGITSVDHTWLQ